jgi:integrase
MAKERLTAPKVAGFTCPADRAQAFLWDSTAPGLALRATPAGKPAYIFQSRFRGKTLRVTIGSPDVWPLESCDMVDPAGKPVRRMGVREKARELQAMIDAGRDPREVKAETIAADVAKRTAEVADVVTVADVWPRYMTEGKPKRKAAWKPRYVADLKKAALPGGEPKKRGKGKTKPGHLAALMPLRLASIDQDTIRDWYAKEAKTAPIQAARAVAMFSGFLGWCATKKDLRALVNKDAARASELGDVLPGVNKRRDALEIDQLPAWFAATDKLQSRAARAYLQALVLTGARREEMAGLRWADVDFRWQKLTLADKVDSTRVIPLAPYMAQLLGALPRHNEWVFASVRLKKGPKGAPPQWVSASASGRIAEPRAPHADVLADAGIPHVSIHGLRRSFSLLGEAAGAPAGDIAQVMGHRPSAIAEGYRPRSIDALRPYLAQIERFILDKAGIQFDPAAPVGLRLVTPAA